MLGPAFVAAIAYVDPGNVAANLQAGARYGYLLVWVLVVATVAAGLVQYLSAALGVVSERSLPDLIGERSSRGTRLAFWAQAELVAMATDIAEVVGGAIALQLLFDLPLVWGGAIAGGISMLLLVVGDRRGQRVFERVIAGMLLIIGLGFLAGLVVHPPDPAAVAGGLVPRLAGTDSLLLALAMLGATLMPHVVYLHSALTRDRFAGSAPEELPRILTATRIDVLAAMAVAGTVNIGLLLLAATALHGQRGEIDTIDGAHAAVSAASGPVVGTLLAIGLLASGLASTSVGSQAGAVIMQGLLRRRIPLLVRRMVTLVPALGVLIAGLDPTAVLVISQVVLSFGIPFVLVPLVRLAGAREVMGAHRARSWVLAVGWLIALAVSALNIYLLFSVLAG